MSPEDVERRLRVYRLEVEPVTKDVATTAARSSHASPDRADRLFIAAVRLRGGHGLVAGEKRMRGKDAAGSASVQATGYLIDVRDPKAQLP